MLWNMKPIDELVEAGRGVLRPWLRLYLKSKCKYFIFRNEILVKAARSDEPARW